MAHDNDNDLEIEQTDQPDIRALRKAADAGKKAQDELQQMKRELLFAKAGIDTESKIGALLFKTWDGEDVETLKVEASELGIGSVGEKPKEQLIPDEEKEQQAFRQSFSRGEPAGAADLPERDPYDEAYDLFHDARKAGRSMDDAGLAAIDRVLVAAATGDQRAIFNANAWANEQSMQGHRFDR